MDIWDRIRHARDRAQQAEDTEKQRLADADTAELQQAASVRLATRQAVREALDDILGDEGDEQGTGSDPDGAAQGAGSEPDAAQETDAATGDDAPLTGTSTSVEEPDPSYAGAGTPDGEDVQQNPGAQSAG